MHVPGSSLTLVGNPAHVQPVCMYQVPPSLWWGIQHTYSQCACTRFHPHSGGESSTRTASVQVPGSSLTLVGNPAHVQPVCKYQVTPSLWWGIQHTCSQCASTRFLPHSGGESSTRAASVQVPGSSLTLVGNPAHVQPVCKYQVPPSLWWGIQHTCSQCASTRFLPHSGGESSTRAASVQVPGSSLTLVGNPAHVQPVCKYQVPPSLWWGIQHTCSQCACTRFLPHSGGESSTRAASVHVPGSSLTLVGNPSHVHVQPVCKYQVPPSLWWGSTRFLPHSGGESSTRAASVQVPGSSLTLVGNPDNVQPVCMYQVPPSLWWGIQHTYSQCACTRFLPHSGWESSTRTASVHVPGSSLTLVGNPAHVQPVCMYQVPPSLWWGIQHTYSQCACTRFLPHSGGESSTRTASVHVPGFTLTLVGNPAHVQPVCKYQVPPSLWWGIQHTFSQCASTRLLPHSGGESNTRAASVQVPGSSLTLVGNPAHVQRVCKYQVPPSLWWGIQHTCSQCASTRFLPHSGGESSTRAASVQVPGSSLTLVGNPAHVQPVCKYQVPPSLWWGIQHTCSQCASTRFLPHSGGESSTRAASVHVPGSSLTLVGNPAHVQPVCMYQVPPSLWWGIHHTYMYSQCASTRFLPHSGGEVPGSSLTLVGNPAHVQPVCKYQVPPSLWWGIQTTYSQCACTRFLPHSGGESSTRTASVHVPGSSLTLVGNPAHVQPVCMYQVPPSLWWGIQHTYSQCACTRFLPHSGGESSTRTASVHVPGSSLTLVGNPAHVQPVCMYQVSPSLWWGTQHTYSQCACTRFLPHSGVCMLLSLMPLQLSAMFTCTSLCHALYTINWASIAIACNNNNVYFTSNSMHDSVCIIAVL